MSGKPTYTGNDCDGCGRNRVEHSCWDAQGREICEKCWKVQGSDDRVNPDAYESETERLRKALEENSND